MVEANVVKEGTLEQVIPEQNRKEWNPKHCQDRPQVLLELRIVMLSGGLAWGSIRTSCNIIHRDPIPRTCDVINMGGIAMIKSFKNNLVIFGCEICIK